MSKAIHGQVRVSNVGGKLRLFIWNEGRYSSDSQWIEANIPYGNFWMEVVDNSLRGFISFPIAEFTAELPQEDPDRKPENV